MNPVPLTPVADYPPYAKLTQNVTGIGRKSMICQWLVMGLLAASITALYILHFAGEASRGNVVTFFSEQLAVHDQFSKGMPVALSNQGKLMGSGISFYVNDGVVLPTVNPYLQFLSLSSNSFVSLYRSGTTATEALIMETNDNDDILRTTSNTPLGDLTIKGTAQLSSDTAVLLNIDSQHSVFATIAKLSATSVTTAQNHVKIAEGSPSNAIAAVSSNLFVVAYYEKYQEKQPYSCQLRYGQLNQDGSIELSESHSFGKANLMNGNVTTMTTFGYPTSLKGIPNSVVVPYHTIDTDSVSNPTYGGLCLRFEQISSDKKMSTLNSKDVCFEKYAPSNFPDSTPLSDDTVAVIFYDTKNNNALTIVTVSVVLDKSKSKYKMIIRQEFIVQIGGDFDFGENSEFFPRPSIKKISSSRIAVVYLDPSNDGKATVSVLDWQRHRQIAELTFPVVLSAPEFNIAVKSTELIVTTTLTTLNENRFIIGVSGIVKDQYFASFILGEVFPSPIGVVTDSSGTDVNVAVEGVISYPDLVKGFSYFSTTKGSLVPGDVPGHQEGSFSVSHSPLSRTIVVAPQSLVGVALTSDKLALVKTN